MSCYICDHEHIVFLVQSARLLCQRFVTTNPCVSDNGCVATAAMLAAENARSVNENYGGSEAPDTFTIDDILPLPDTVDPVQVLKSIACYRYQTSEAPNWETSDAFNFCEMLQQTAIQRLPGYKEAVWGAPI